MPATTTFPDILPDRSSQRTRQGRFLETDFGDNYTQRAPDGLNAFTERWQLSFANYPDSLVDQITDFLDDRIDDAQPFFWTPPLETATTPVKQWRLDGEYRRRPIGFQSSTLTFTVQRDFTP